MQAYNNDPALKTDLLNQMRVHRKADAVISGRYWEGGKGCAVGCLTHDPDGGHDKYEQWGIPKELAYLEDVLFESLPKKEALVWPERFLSAIPVGADLSGIWHQWCAETLRMDLLTLKEVKEDKAATAAIEAVAVLHESNAADASAWNVACSVAKSAYEKTARRAVKNAVWSAGMSDTIAIGVHAVKITVWSAVMSIVLSASENAGKSDGMSACERSASNAAWTKMANRLIRLIESLPYVNSIAL